MNVWMLDSLRTIFSIMGSQNGLNEYAPLCRFYKSRIELRQLCELIGLSRLILSVLYNCVLSNFESKFVLKLKLCIQQ